MKPVIINKPFRGDPQQVFALAQEHLRLQGFNVYQAGRNSLKATRREKIKRAGERLLRGKFHETVRAPGCGRKPRKPGCKKKASLARASKISVDIDGGYICVKAEPEPINRQAIVLIATLFAFGLILITALIISTSDKSEIGKKFSVALMAMLPGLNALPFVAKGARKEIKEALKRFMDVLNPEGEEKKSVKGGV